VKAIGRQVFVTEVPLFEIDAAAEALHFANEVTMLIEVSRDISEMRRDGGLWRSQQDEPLLDRRYVSLEESEHAFLRAQRSRHTGGAAAMSNETEYR
jgi:hypothetical protein